MVPPYPVAPCAFRQGFADGCQEVGGMLKLIGKRMLVLVSMHTGSSSFQQVSAVNEVGQRGADVTQQIHQLTM